MPSNLIKVLWLRGTNKNFFDEALKKRCAVKLSGHIVSTLTISGLVYLVFKSLTACFVSLLAGILIDIDHILDYYIERGITLKIKNIYQWCMERNYKIVFLVFHSIELIFILWISITLFKLGLFWIAIAIGLTQHMILDIFFNKRIIYPYAYFLSFRIIKGLRRECICRQFQCPTLEK